MTNQPVKIICTVCGSEDVTADASAKWCVENQCYELTDTCDTYHCEDCDGECKAKEVPVSFKWTVEFEVDEIWVADGFDLDDDRAINMLNMDLTLAMRDSEIKAKVLKAPDKATIRRVQGYKDDQPQEPV